MAVTTVEEWQSVIAHIDREIPAIARTADGANSLGDMLDALVECMPLQIRTEAKAIANSLHDVFDRGYFEITAFGEIRRTALALPFPDTEIGGNISVTREADKLVLQLPRLPNFREDLCKSLNGLVLFILGLLIVVLTVMAILTGITALAGAIAAVVLSVCAVIAAIGAIAFLTIYCGVTPAVVEWTRGSDPVLKTYPQTGFAE